MAERPMTIEARIFLAVDEDADDEAINDIANQMDLGLSMALGHFPAADIVDAEVETIRDMTAEEKSSHWEEG